MNGFAKGFAFLLMSASTLAPSIGMAVPQELPVSNATLEIAVDADNVVIDDPVVEEVTVVGEAAGPGLWKVRNGDNTLYILGTLSPLPKKMEWRSREVERVLTRADRLIPASSKVDADIGPISAVQLYFQYRKLRGNEDKQSLQAILPPDLYARFEKLRQKYAPRDTDMQKRRPVLAAGELWREAISRSGLTSRNDVNKAVEKLARKNKVKIVQPELRIDDPKATLAEVARIPRDAELACMRSTLDRLEYDLALARQRAEDWSLGDIAGLRSSNALAQQETCWSALMQSPRVADIRRQFDEQWLKLVYDSLENHSISLAVVPITELFKKNGVLDLLRSRGYRVEEP
jgi:uncharacterized protein YbaP (TraB family)